jgi:hypothetical protein
LSLDLSSYLPVDGTNADATPIANAFNAIAAYVNGLNLTEILAVGAAAGAAITNVTDPTNPQDAATKNYVDSHGSGIALLWDSTTAGVTFPTASFTTATLSGSYKQLLTVWRGRTDAAGVGGVSCLVRLNGDSGSNYDYEANDNGTYSNVFATTSILAGVATGATAPANSFGSGTFWLPGYSDSTQEHTGLFQAMEKQATGSSLHIRQSGGYWRNTAAITTVTFLAGSGSNWVSGTRASVYGVS